MRIYIIVVLVAIILSNGCIEKTTPDTSNLIISEYNISVGNQINVDGSIWNKGLVDEFNISISLETKEKKILDHIYIKRLKAGESTKFILNSTYNGYSKSNLQLILKVKWEENGRQNELQYLLDENN